MTTFHQSDWRACCEFVLQAPQNATIRGCHQATLLHLAHESFPLIPHRDRQDRTCVPKTPPPKKVAKLGRPWKYKYIKARFICSPAISCLFHVDSFFEDLVQIARLKNIMLNSLGCKIVRKAKVWYTSDSFETAPRINYFIVTKPDKTCADWSPSHSMVNLFHQLELEFLHHQNIHLKSRPRYFPAQKSTSRWYLKSPLIISLTSCDNFLQSPIAA